MRTDIRYDDNGTIWGYVEPLGMWMEFETDEAYYELLESYENREGD